MLVVFVEIIVGYEVVYVVGCYVVVFGLGVGMFLGVVGKFYDIVLMGVVVFGLY